MFKSALKYCCLVLAACVGSFAYAANLVEGGAHFGRLLLSDEGTFGKAMTKFKAEQNFMTDASETRMCSSTGALMKQSHGFLQARASEVTKGTTGSTVSLYS